METDNQWKMDSFLEEERLKSTMTIPKAISLLKDKHAANMIQRHVRALNRIAKNNKNGYMLKDLLSLCELITVSIERVKISMEYASSLEGVISCCKLPFLKEKMSDEATFAPCVIEIFSLFGRMISESTYHTVRQEIITTVGDFYEGKNANEIQLPDDIQQSRVGYNMAMIERSAVARSVTKGLIITNDTQELIVILNTLAIFSGNSCINCDHILLVDGGSILTRLLASMDNKIVFLSIEILWNLLEKGSHLQINEQLGSFEALKNFQGLFKRLMLRSTSNQMKQLRNDLVSLMTLLASSCVSVPFVETGFLTDICDFIKRSDVVACSSAAHLADYNLTNDPEDFELIKLLICLLTSLRSLPAATIVLSQTNVLQSIFSYIVPNDVENTKWNSAQFEEIQLLCLSCLSLLSPLCIRDYMECQGNTSLLLLIDWCSTGEYYSGHGNSFHGNGGRGNKLSELRYCLRVLLSVSTIDNNSLVLQDLHEQGVIPLLIDLLKKLSSCSNSTNSSLLIEIQSDSLVILSSLCYNDNHRKELFGGYDGIPILMKYLKKDPNDFSSGCGHDRLLLSAVDCTWSTVIGNNVVEDIFLENGGIFSLMDMLQKSPHKLQGLLIGVLVDLCDNPKSLSHVTAWQGMGTTNCWSLLARLWRQEENNLGVIRDMGTLAGTTLPLVGAEQNALGMPPLPTRQPSAAINDISDNNRARLYALCSKIGFNYPGDSMITEEKITMCIIENYLSFKTGEVWYEVAGELAQEGLRPTTPDQEDLQEILQSFEERAEDVIKQQHELMDEQHRVDLDDEYRFYEKLRDAQFSKERTLEKRDKLLMRTSNIKHLKEAKERQQTVIDASRPSDISLGERFHTTDLDYSSLNVTAFCGRHVTVPSTQIKLLQHDNNKLAQVN